MDATFPDGVFFNPVSVHEVDTPSGTGLDDDGSKNNLHLGEAVDTITTTRRNFSLNSPNS